MGLGIQPGEKPASGVGFGNQVTNAGWLLLSLKLSGFKILLASHKNCNQLFKSSRDIDTFLSQGG